MPYFGPEDDHNYDDLSVTARTLLYARRDLGLTRPMAAALFEGNAHSLYRWETDQRRISAADFDRIMKAYDAYRESRPIANVPRGTAPYAKTRMGTLIDQFEREVIRMSATDFEIDYVRAVLSAPTTRRLLNGEDGSPLNADDQEAELTMLMESLRVWLRLRIQRRAMVKAVATGTAESTKSGAPELELRRPQRPVIPISKGRGKKPK